MTARRLQAYFLLIVTAVIWGVAGPVIKFTLAGVTVLLFLFYRFGLAAIATLFTGKKGLRLPKSKALILEIMIFAFVTSSLSLGFLFLGLRQTTVLDMTLIAVSGPLMITAAGAYFLKDHITHQEKLGIGIVLLGVFFTTIRPLIQNGDGIFHLSGNVFILLHLVANTVSALMAKMLVRKKIPPLVLSNYSFIVGFITIAPMTLAAYGNQIVPSLRSLSLSYHLGVAYMAFISGNIAYTLWVRAQKTIEVSEAALFAYLQPIFAIPIAVIWLGETITSTLILGAILISLGVVIAEYKRRKT